MKKLSFLFLMGAATLTQAQPYGEWSWQDNELTLSSASYNVNIPGHLMAGHYFAGPNSGKFRILKIDQNGAAIFDEQYDVAANPSCPIAPPLTPAAGVCVIETSSPLGPYALSGSVDRGCFFATLDASGTPQNVTFYTFPNSVSSQVLSSTSLVEVGPALGGGFVMTGSYMGLINGSITRLMYVLRLDALGNPMQSASFHNAVLNPCHLSGYELEPSAILVSPYTPNPTGIPELVVVGEARALGSTACTPGFVQHSQGFFMRLELNTLNWLSTRFYRYNNGPLIPETNDFKSITPSIFSGQNYFVIGGYSETAPTTLDKALMMLVDETGVLQWSHTYNSSFSDTRACVQVVQRISPTYGPTFYGAVISRAAGMMCFKVDAGGTPFSSATPIDNYNEFNYQNGPTGPLQRYETGAMSVEPNTGNSEGIHVYGVGESAPGLSDNWYMVKASFNGFSATGGNCGNTTTSNQMIALPGPQYDAEIQTNKIAGPSVCPYITLTNTSFVTVANTMCSIATAGANNSNNRPTGLSEQVGGFDLSVVPNPVQNQLRVNFASAPVSPVVRISNLNGQLVGELTLLMDGNSGSTTLEQLDLPNGVYFLEAQTQQGKMITKLLLQR